ncbi:tRNA pseudouridine(38-40) synthase [Ranunculus cassubicifolius]
MASSPQPDLQQPQPDPQSEPLPKKLKMSTATSDDEELTTTTEPSSTDRKPRYKRRKVAIFLAYCGVGYQGMQKNPGAKTIEGDLEEALYLAGGIPEPDRGKPQRFDWARSARTDKGVSAVGQVVSGRFYVDPPGFVDRVNSHLPNQIRIFGFKRVTNSFSAKKFCDRRRYVYLVPVFALDPNSHPARESVLASLGSENELVKCSECPERGRKVAGAMGKHNRQGKVELVDSNENKLQLESEISPSDNGEECSNGDEKEKGVLENRAKFCYGEKDKERFNRILNHYLGTHNFHNFTTRIKAEDPSSTRYIISFNADSVVTVEGMDFVKCEVVGQSFMLHQIRKLIGLAVAIMRNCAPESLIEHALQKDVNITVPTAPEVGLYLEECLFSSYNQKWRETHEEISMEAYAQEAEDFKMKQIYSHIASMEQKEGSIGIWLHSLNCRNYPDLRYIKESGDGTNGENLQGDSVNGGTGINGEIVQGEGVDGGASTKGDIVQGDSVEVEFQVAAACK